MARACARPSAAALTSSVGRAASRGRLLGGARAGLVAGAALGLLTGCPSFTTLRTARAIDPGEVQTTAATEVLAMKAPGGTGLGGARPSVAFAARYGIVRDVDVGLEVEPVMGVTVDSTIQLVRGDVDIALGPGLGYFETSVPVAFSSKTVEQIATAPLYTIVSPRLPLLMGFNLSGGHQIVIAPRATTWFVQPQAAQPGGSAVPGGMELFAGMTAGVSLRTVRGVRLFPEIGATVPVAWTGRDRASCLGAACAPVHERSVVINGAIGVTFGADPLVH